MPVKSSTKDHGQENLELVWKEDAAENHCEQVGDGRAVLLHHVIQPLLDGGHNQTSDTTAEEDVPSCAKQ